MIDLKPIVAKIEERLQAYRADCLAHGYYTAVTESSIMHDTMVEELTPVIEGLEQALADEREKEVGEEVNSAAWMADWDRWRFC